MFPAIVIGGPPHSGKSVLLHSLTHALRQRGIAHYVLRACPDGEGDWANEADQTLVQTIRHKGVFDQKFIDEMAGYIQYRQLPLLVDVGGRPQPWQEVIFQHCTHAILLIGRHPAQPEAYEQAKAEWQTRMDKYELPLIALLDSVLHGVDEVQTAAPLTGTITQLERGHTAAGPTFAALLEACQTILTLPTAELATHHQQQLTTDWHFEDLSQLPAIFGHTDDKWQPSDLPHLLARLPADQPVALYGRASAWAYACAAHHTRSAPFQQFATRLGWVRPPTLTFGGNPQIAPAYWQARLQADGDFLRLETSRTAQELDIATAADLPLPAIPADARLIVSGTLPHWFVTALARQLAHLPLLAFFQPQLGGAVVIHSADPVYAVGDVLPLT